MRTRKMTDRMLLEGLVNKYGAKKLTNVINKINEGYDTKYYGTITSLHDYEIESLNDNQLMILANLVKKYFNIDDIVEYNEEDDEYYVDAYSFEDKGLKYIAITDDRDTYAEWRENYDVKSLNSTTVKNIKNSENSPVEKNDDFMVLKVGRKYIIKIDDYYGYDNMYITI